MRVLHAIPTLAPESGGPARSVPALASALAGLPGVTAGLLTFIDESTDADAHGVAVIRCRPLLGTRGGLTPSFLSRVHRELDDWDLVHLHGLWNPLVTTVAAICRRKRVPYVVSPRGMLQAVAMTRSRLKKVVAYRVIERRTIRTAAAVHFLNEVEEAESSVHLAPHQQRFVLPNGVDLAISDAVSSSAFRKKHPRIQGRKVLLYVGRLHWSKDLALQLAALRSLLADRSDVHLVFVGPDEGASGSLLQTVEAMDLQEHFLWTGPLPRREVFEALAAADIFTLTSRHEAHSMAMNEALAMGLPVVLTEGVGFDRIVAWGAGLVVPSDAASLAAAWRKLLDGEGTAAAMGEAARRAAEQHLAWLQIARDMYVNYQQALEGPID